MKRLKYHLPLFALLATVAVALGACAGGSGSSGFDIAGLSEGATIQRALDEQHCIERSGLMICPITEGAAVIPDRPTPSPSATPTAPGPTSAPAISTQLDHTTSLDCTFVAVDNTCLLSVPFQPQGFAPGARFYIAVRNSEPNAPWLISANLPSSDASGSFEAPLQVPAQGMEIQVAILAFNTPPSSVPPQVNELAESGADFAYVTHVLMLSPR